MIIKQIKYLFFFLLTLLLGTTTTHAKTEVVLPQKQVVFSVEQSQRFYSLEKEVQPNIGFLKEKTKFVAVEGVSAENTFAFSECVGGKLAQGGSDLYKSLSNVLKSSYDDLILRGLNVVEDAGTGSIKFFNSENKFVAEITNNKLVFKYNGYGGDIVMTEGKTTTVLGRFNDPVNGGGTKEFIQNSSKVYETGVNPNGINILNLDDWTWAKNEAWIVESANRDDIFRFISDPTNPTNIFKNGVNGEKTITGLEIQTLESLGYVWDASKFQYIKP